ncbi:hypothetical protein EDB81DRAFT_874234 [Dactylonectria macrodidyma]|uniref:Uncharacterized protein n=1 Tax=Dactylonectria macrodidyma TaxID=307937 RepID=A0A9P9FST9_9HYPO|nr:hypothetical protein EDB81DRAFT_874234 [Dactylonectria macrodidyma]
MGRGIKRDLMDFIDSIPDEKLEGFPSSQTTIFRDQNFRLDMQGITSSGDWNLQIQVNYSASSTSLRRIAPKTIAGPVLVSPTNPLAPDQIRAEFKRTFGA